ncbi:hypothetical protein HG535_0B04550 [Zygotorulaspora mrakii]|uniref:Uncharacterized protein n=1 Tax=Zygotorulaspora mrakii TaxID=42260 RepID=A0A7H9AYY1_ZYGMR|nr:uncharacterized protein HG535_0B04550 [Zygotorulaspora mrakii]QLG71413.1 hypothetical protein HG535_0B04550 [Zygotorulaspora mrakii]
MNTPPMRAEQLSPQMSPIAFSLDDPKCTGASSFQHLLASPTKFKLDSGSNDPAANSSASNIYRTSLSKLSELSRTGRSRQRSDSDTLRSVSPIRFQLFNNAPKMLRQEYMTQQPSPSPLLSTLMKSTVTQSNTSNGSTRNNQSTYCKMGIRETLEQIQREQKELLQKQSQLKKEEPNKEKLRAKPSKVRDSVTKETPQPSAKNEKSKINGSQVDIGEVSKAQTCLPNMKDSADVRVNSKSSTISSNMGVDLSDISKELDIELLASNKSVFASFEDSKSNRYSFISSSSTDYDGGDWGNNQPEPRNIHLEETARLDNRIKQLEIEIDNLKLQNVKLIESITTTRTVEDKYMLEALRETRSSKKMVQQGMEKKVKQLEKKVESYRKAIQTCEDGLPELPTITGSGIIDYKGVTTKRRITRISSGELRKIDEQTDSSGTSSDDEKDEQFIKHEKYDDSTLTKELFRQQCSDQSSMRRKQGLQLNIQLQMQKTKR